jgi:hypothetical protein
MRYNLYMHRTPALLYLIYHERLRAFKVGINNIGNSRYSAHRLNGWKIVDYWYFDSIVIARKVERIVLSRMKDKTKGSGFVDKQDMPQGGYTETFDADKITSRGVKIIINKVIRNLI